MPRIVINPAVMEDRRDAMAVAWNEGLRAWMEMNGFEPKAEPTEKQRAFFEGTAYADDEVMLRRTILARIATRDTSVKDPTPEQAAETRSLLEAVAGSDAAGEGERGILARMAEGLPAGVPE